MLNRANQAGRWLWTLIAIGMGFVLFFGVDKIRLLWWDAPSLGLWSDDPFRVLGMHGYRVLLGVLYIYALLALVPHAAKVATWTRMGFKTGRFMSWPARMLNRLSEPLLVLLRVGEENDGRNRAGKALLAIGVLASVGLPGVWCMAGVTLTMSGIWLVLSDPLDGDDRIPEERRAATAVGGRALLLFVFSAVFGIILWFVVESPKTVLTHRLFTLWACAHFWLSWLCLAAYVDSIVERTVTRVGLGLGVILLLVVVQTHEVRLGEGACEVKLPADDCEELGAGCVWMDEALARVEAMPDQEGPVLLVAASGGGTRAALHATLVLEALERTPAIGPIGEWDELSQGALSEQILAISSVSGGSVASAHWVTEQASVPEWCAGGLPEGVVPPECTLRNTIDAELDMELATEHAALCKVIEDTDRWRTLCDMDTTAGWQPDNDWPHRSRRFDDLSTDFTAPLVQGVLLPGIERGESMSGFWESHFDWTRGPEDPLLLVNVTEVFSGARIVSGHPPLPRHLLADEGTLGEAHSVSSLGSHFCLSVEESVRLSANFPWGFGLPKVEGPEGDILLLDGGVLDNTGLDTLAVLFERMLYLAEHATGKDTPGLHERSRRLLNAIAPRGVVVLEVDSGAKPEPPGIITRGLSELLMPVHSLNTSAFARAVSASEANIERINGVLETWAQRMVATNTLFWPDPDVAEDHCNLAEGDTPTNVDVIGTRVEHVVYALDTESIITAWALTPEQKAQVIARFLNEDATQRLELKDAYEDMRGESELMRMTARSALDSPQLSDLFETLAWDRRHLHSLKEASVAAETRRRSETRTGVAVTSRPARVDEGWALIGTVYQGVWRSSAMPFGVTEDVWHDTPTPFELDVTEPLLVRHTRPDLSNQGWSFPSGLVEVGGCVEVAETCRISYLNGMTCTEETLLEEVPELVFARVRACPEVIDN